MDYFSAYWTQLKIFYRIFFRDIFARERQLDLKLSEFVMKPGFFWQMLEVHVWLGRSVVNVFKNILQLLLCYISMAAICVFLLAAPLFILLMFPVFTIGRYRRIRAQGERL